MSVLLPTSRLVLVRQSGPTETVCSQHTLHPTQQDTTKQTNKQTKQLFAEDGSPRVYHNVIKNGVFSFVVGQAPVVPEQKTPAVSFASTGVHCTLVYDHNWQKTVDGITQKPMEYKLVPLSDGSQLRIDARIRVLSSQLGGSLFRVLVQLLDKDKRPIPDYTILSQPIRVRSKIKTVHPQKAARSGARRPLEAAARPQEAAPAMKRQRQALSGLAATAKAAEEPAEVPDDEGDHEDELEELLGAATEAGAANTSAALVMRALARIEKRQQQQQQYLDNLMVVASTPKRMLPQTPSDTTSLQSSCATPEELASDVQLTSPVDARIPQTHLQQPPFSAQLLRLMDMYDGMTEEEKQEQLGLLQSAATARQSQNMAAVLSYGASALSSQQHLPPALTQGAVVSDDDFSFPFLKEEGAEAVDAFRDF